MSMRYPGGFITKATVTPTLGSASGIWTLQQATQYIKAGTWPFPATYWIGTLGYTAAGFGVAVDSSNNVYIVGYGDAGFGSSNEIEVAKYNSLGVIQWQRVLKDTSSNDDLGYGITIDSSNNVYITGQCSTFVGFAIAKYNSLGTLQWQRELYSAGAVYSTGYSIAVDASNNVYAVGENKPGVTSAIQINKYNSSGVVQWQRQLSSGTNDLGTGIAIDSAGNNIYIVGTTNYGSTGSVIIAKYDSSGIIQWQRTLAAQISQTYNRIALDSSSNLYIVSYTFTGSGTDVLLAKYNSSGAIQWQRSLGGTASSYGYGISLDSSNNVYVVGSSTASGTQDVQLAKYNSSGTIQWQRRLRSSGTEVGYNVKINSLGVINLIGYTNISSRNYFLIAALPPDGSSTGTYTVNGVSFTYEASSLTAQTTTLTDAASSLTDSATSLTDQAISLTDVASTMTSSVTIL